MDRSKNGNTHCLVGVHKIVLIDKREQFKGRQGSLEFVIEQLQLHVQEIDLMGNLKLVGLSSALSSLFYHGQQAPGSVKKLAHLRITQMR